MVRRIRSVQLSAAGTLQLFRALHDAAAAASVPLPHHLLARAADASRSDARSAARDALPLSLPARPWPLHRLRAFCAKEPIRPVSGRIDKLKTGAHHPLLELRCAGGPETQTACNYCRAPIAILDPKPSRAAGTRRCGGPAHGHRQSGGRRRELGCSATRNAARRGDAAPSTSSASALACSLHLFFGEKQARAMRQHRPRGAFAGRVAISRYSTENRSDGEAAGDDYIGAACFAVDLDAPRHRLSGPTRARSGGARERSARRPQ